MLIMQAIHIGVFIPHHKDRERCIVPYPNPPNRQQKEE